MKKIPTSWFLGIQFIPIINIFSFVLVFWNVIATKFSFKKLLCCYIIIVICYFVPMTLLNVIAMIIPFLSKFVLFICAYLCPILYTYGFTKYQERW